MSGAAPGRAEPGADASERRFRRALVALFALLQLALLFFHEPWRDELNLWLIAREVPDFGAFWTILDHGGHGRLWHSGVWLLARASDDVLAARILQVLVATAAVAVFVRFAPFSRTSRALFALGYFPLFEYGAIARPYGLGMLLLFAACAVAGARPRRPVATAALLGLLAHTTVFGAFAAGGMAAAWATARWRDARSGREALPAARSMAAAGAVLLVLLGVAAVHMKPAPTATFASEWTTRWGAERAVAVVDLAHRAAAPVLPLRREFRNAHVLEEHRLLSAALGIGLAAGAVLLLRPQPPALVLCLGTGVATLALAYTKGIVGARHLGILFLAFVAAAWWAELDPARARHRRARRAALAALLALHAVAGLQAFALDVRFPFSGSRAAGRWLRAELPPDRPLVGHPHPAMSPVAYWAGRPFWSAEWSGPATYHYHHRGAQRRRWQEVVDLTVARADEDGREAFLVAARRLDGLPAAAELVACFDAAILPDERYFVYRIPAGAVRELPVRVSDSGCPSPGR